MNCLVCGLPLEDPISISYGIGPICREKAIMSNNLNEVIKHLPGQHTQRSHGRRQGGGIAGAQDALNVSATDIRDEMTLQEAQVISFYRKGGRRPGVVLGQRPDGRYDVQGYDGKKYIVDPNRKRTKVKIEESEVEAVGKKPKPKQPEVDPRTERLEANTAKRVADWEAIRESGHMKREPDWAMAAKYVEDHSAPFEKNYIPPGTESRFKEPIGDTRKVRIADDFDLVYEASPQGKEAAIDTVVALNASDRVKGVMGHHSQFGASLPPYPNPKQGYRGTVPEPIVKAVTQVTLAPNPSYGSSYGGKGYNNSVNASSFPGKQTYREGNYGMYSEYGSSQIVVWKNKPLDKRLLAHEGAHNYAREIYNGSSTPTRESRFGKLTHNALYSDPVMQAKSEQPVRVYGRTNGAEDFATAVEMYTTDPLLMKDKFPKRYRAVEQALNDPEAAAAPHKGRF